VNWPHRGGGVLVEVVAAMTVLALTLGSSLGFLVQAGDTVRRAQQHEAQVRAAGQFFEAVALWPVAELDRRLGIRRQGAWLLWVDRIEPGLYDVRLLTPDSLPLLETVLSRSGGA
jgi:type II secretory pathway pseudopilin PulG